MPGDGGSIRYRVRTSRRRYTTDQSNVLRVAPPLTGLDEHWTHRGSSGHSWWEESGCRIPVETLSLLAWWVKEEGVCRIISVFLGS